MIKVHHLNKLSIFSYHCILWFYLVMLVLVSIQSVSLVIASHWLGIFRLIIHLFIWNQTSHSPCQPANVDGMKSMRKQLLIYWAAIIGMECVVLRLYWEMIDLMWTWACPYVIILIRNIPLHIDIFDRLANIQTKINFFGKLPSMEAVAVDRIANPQKKTIFKVQKEARKRSDALTSRT